MKRWLGLCVLVSVMVGGARARAQDGTADPLAIPGEEPAATPTPASSPPEVRAESGGEGERRGFGVGIAALLSNRLEVGQGANFAPFGPALLYDSGKFHIEGILAFRSSSMDVGGGNRLHANAVGLAGRFWYHVHHSTSTDFSVGGGLGFVNVNVDNPGVDQTDIDFEGGGQIRYFPVSNVSLSAALGLAVAAGDATGVELTGDLVGGFGLGYYFL